MSNWVISGSGSGRALAAALAAVLPEVVRQTAKRVVVGGVVVERALLATHEHLRLDESLQVVAQRRRGQVDVALDLARGAAALTALHDESQDC